MNKEISIDGASGDNTAQTIARLALAGSQSNDGLPHVFLPEDFRVHDLEKLLEAPNRIRHKAEFYDADSFVQYVTDYADMDAALFYVLPVRKVSGNTVIIKCFLDAHENTIEAGPVPSWSTHQATLYVSSSPEYDVWVGKNGQFMPQGDFCEFLEDYACDVVDPSSAQLVSLARNLRVKQNIEVQSAVNLESGETELQYIEKHDTSASKAGGKGTIKVPDKVKIKIPLFMSDDPIELTAAFRYRVGGPAVAFGYRIPRLEQIVMDRVREIVDSVKKALPEKSLIYYGSGEYQH